MSVTKKQKLELTWIGKENRPRLEPRILLEDPEKSYHAKQRVTENDVFDNRLIFGDNLLALKALEQEFTGKIKCIYIDPPYNTGSAFEHYDDGVEHSIWLSVMRDRMELIRHLLSEEGSVWISLDDNESHYFKVMMDEVFGRQNFVATIIWQKVFTVKNSARHFSDMHDYVVVYAKDATKWQRNLLPRSEELDSTYSNPDKDPRGPWTTNAVQARNYYSLGEYEIRSPAGKSFFPPKGTYWRVSQSTFEELNRDARVWWGRDGTSIPRIKKFLSEAKQGVVPATLWFHDDCGTNAEAKTEVRSVFSAETDAEMFITPKPERLLKRILEIASNPGDWVLDSFAGSGTTGAVAHKMGRRWIMVELGEHCHTHIIPRLKKVIDGADSGGITGDNYESLRVVDQPTLTQFTRCSINIFNISKINSEVRGGKSPRIKRLSEYIGESYFEYLAGLPDLVLIMDESHRYRASAGVRAINELKPVIGLELTATPFVEMAKGGVPFKNVILDYPLGRAMADGFVKEPAVVTRKNFNPAGMTAEAIELMKLQDGVRLHEQVKVELETYARESGNVIVKPFILVIARDTTHAKQLVDLVQSDQFFDGRYKTKVIQVDSSKTGAEEDEMVERLLKVEHTDEPTEIVIHVNMLKEGWDVTNLYTIIPLRAANARILIEQSIGRGLRLPYGKRTGVNAVDRLNIIAHDKFQEIVDEAKRPDSAIRLQQVILEPEQLGEKTVTVVSQSQLASQLGLQPAQTTTSTLVPQSVDKPAFTAAEEQKVAQITYEVIRTLENQPQLIPGISYLKNANVQALVLNDVTSQYRPAQLEIEGVTANPDIAAIVAKTMDLVIRQTIDIPRILVVPTGMVQSGFHPFTIKLDALNYAPVSEELWVKHLRTDQVDVIATGVGGIEESRLEDYVVSGLVDFDDVSYDAHADLLYHLAGQVVRHLQSYLSDENEVRKVLSCHQREIARFVHVQMQDHYWEKATGYEVKISKGFSELKASAYTASASGPVLDYRQPPADKSNMAKYLFGGFQRCLYPVQKFQSDTERKLSIILERETSKWFKPAKGQFQIYYKSGANQLEYQPDFVAETDSVIYMLEPKSSAEMAAAEVLAKSEAAVKWCGHASDHAKTYQGKPWNYLLIPHDMIAENITLDWLASRFEQK